MDSPGPKGRGLSRPSRGLETSGWEQIPPLALGGCSPPPFAGLLCTQRSPRLWKLLPCCGVYWILGSLRSSATDKCSRMAQHTLDPVTSSGQKLQHGGPPEVDAETEFIETPLSMSGWTLSPTASHGLAQARNEAAPAASQTSGQPGSSAVYLALPRQLENSVTALPCTSSDSHVREQGPRCPALLVAVTAHIRFLLRTSSHAHRGQGPACFSMQGKRALTGSRLSTTWTALPSHPGNSAHASHPSDFAKPRRGCPPWGYSSERKGQSLLSRSARLRMPDLEWETSLQFFLESSSFCCGRELQNISQ
ncbi:uncharacterized protein [Equus caballus]|uniref:uncharacterized protein isoform X1 n=1 Tax=Equus caballus TaxID=9796 RepID=UPI0038B38A52